MEKILINAVDTDADDFVVVSLDTLELPDDDETKDPEHPMVTHGKAVRKDGAELFFQFRHGTKGIISKHFDGAAPSGHLKLGFYMRKKEKATESKIISLGKNILSVN